MKIDWDWQMLGLTVSIFIRGGESGFMTYCLKWEARHGLAKTVSSHSPQPFRLGAGRLRRREPF